jgi:hypothetical protein
MGDVQAKAYHTFWTNKLSTLKSEYQTVVQQYPKADAQLKQLLKVMGNTEDVARGIPVSVGKCAEWAVIVNAAEESGASYCKSLHRKQLFSALYGTYRLPLYELMAMPKASTLGGQINLPKKQSKNNARG